MDIFIDFEHPNIIKLTDEEAGKIQLTKLKSIISSIGKRYKQIKTPSMLYDVPSVALYNQAKDLYCFGYFISAIMVCRSAAEYLAFEIFIEEIEINGKVELIDSIAESLDFRKIVNDFLYNSKKGYKIIDEETHKLFNILYNLGNEWIHPKRVIKKVRIEDEACKAVEALGSLLSSLRDVMKDYKIYKGKLIKKMTARRKMRPIVLGFKS